jgi:hypothetical protein
MSEQAAAPQPQAQSLAASLYTQAKTLQHVAKEEAAKEIALQKEVEQAESRWADYSRDYAAYNEKTKEPKQQLEAIDVASQRVHQQGRQLLWSVLSQPQIALAAIEEWRATVVPYVAACENKQTLADTLHSACTEFNRKWTGECGTSLLTIIAAKKAELQQQKSKSSAANKAMKDSVKAAAEEQARRKEDLDAMLAEETK